MTRRAQKQIGIAATVAMCALSLLTIAQRDVSAHPVQAARTAETNLKLPPREDFGALSARQEALVAGAERIRSSTSSDPRFVNVSVDAFQNAVTVYWAGPPRSALTMPGIVDEQGVLTSNGAQLHVAQRKFTKSALRRAATVAEQSGDKFSSRGLVIEAIASFDPTFDGVLVKTRNDPDARVAPARAAERAGIATELTAKSGVATEIQHSDQPSGNYAGRD